MSDRNDSDDFIGEHLIDDVLIVEEAPEEDVPPSSEDLIFLEEHLSHEDYGSREMTWEDSFLITLNGFETLARLVDETLFWELVEDIFKWDGAAQA